ncbi:MAG TPA: Uma2 family endonuclease [Planctomycetota bacterium]|nr:Uma2 family endonuclease [Planctomycetota bacterium]
MTWQEVCDDKSLQNLPYKIELDQWGRIVMSPANNRHGKFQMRFGSLWEKHLSGGVSISECSIDTPLGTKVADAAWASDAFIETYGYDTPYPVAPEICVEVRSFSNTAAEIAEKIMLYLSKGAKEVWICDKDGEIAFHDHTGPIPHSKLVPGFPSKI